MPGAMYGLLGHKRATTPSLQAMPEEEELESLRRTYTDITKGTSVEPILIEE